MQILRMYLVASVMAFAPGCAVFVGSIIDPEGIKDWPTMKVEEHYVSTEDMVAKCTKHLGPDSGVRPLACAEFYFDHKKCHIWYSNNPRPSQWIIDHERAHCRGHDHIGSNQMKKDWEAWKLWDQYRNKFPESFDGS